jgi:acyl-CoA reductase-like NAD-dependent aldehyde dehydrogenase
VHDSLCARFVEAALPLLRAYVLGDPTEDGVSMGPMAQPWAPEKLSAHVGSALAGGAKALTGGKAAQVDGKGRFFEPTLLVDTTAAMDVMRVESFGPILPVVRVGSDDEALAQMNDSDLGLTAAIYTSDRERALRMAKRLETGTVFVNQCDTLDPALPWTGVKDSGKGSTLSALGYLHLTRPKGLNFKL